MDRRKRVAQLFAACWMAAAGFLPADAADIAKHYPERPIRLVIAQTPGSSIDAMGRVVAIKMSEVLGQQLVVDNRTGRRIRAR